MTPSGSSPRGRGKREEPARRRNRRWLIPARAGKTASSCRARVDRAAHPRAGGENAEHRADPVDESGSSPRGRGKRRIPATQDLRRGLIPARAGKTRRCRREPVKERGSSPRGRGKLDQRGRRGAERRLIPARAGKTQIAVVVAGGEEAHPRAGGENDARYIPLIHERGSSPRGLGKRHGRPRPRALIGLIPARAGKT